MLRAIIIRVLSVCLLLSSLSCVASTPSDSQLLSQDYRQLENAELIAYEQALSDAYSRSLQTGSRGVSIGLGFGSWSGSSGFGVGVDREVGGSGEGAQSRELRLRRDLVRDEMRRRGLLTAE